MERCEIYYSAVANERGTKILFADSSNSATSLHTLRPGGKVISEISTVRIDDLFAEVWVDLIKIDVEGSEEEVLEGARNLIGRTRPNVLVEVLNDWAKTRLMKFFSDLNYGEPITLDKRNLFFSR